MLVLRSKSRPIASPPKRDPYVGHTRQMLGMAKNRRGPVTLPAVRCLAAERQAAASGQGAAV